MTYAEEVLRRICVALDANDIWWNTEEDGQLLALVNCNDFFAWACADAEPIRLDDIALYEQAAADCVAADKSDAYAGLLYCARKRGLRPQGAYYDHIPKQLWPLFDACGGKRTVQFGNPKAHPNDRAEAA